jgi:predicted nucleotidyltransferase
MSALSSALEFIENKHNIIILFASEVGSQRHGYASVTSDYDIHFVWIFKNLENYFKLKEKFTTIVDQVINDNEMEINFAGYSLQDFLIKLHGNTANIIDMLTSHLVYVNLNSIKENLLELYTETMNIESLQASYWGWFKTSLIKANMNLKNIASDKTSLEGLNKKNRHRLLNKCFILGLRLFLICKWFEKTGTVDYPSSFNEWCSSFDLDPLHQKEIDVTMEKLKSNTCSELHSPLLYTYLQEQEKIFQLLIRKNDKEEKNGKDEKTRSKSFDEYDKFYFETISKHLISK